MLGEPLRLTRLSGAAPLLVVPVPLPPPAFSLWELSDTARLLVLIIDPNARNLAAAAALQAGFGLTAAEARVATLIGSGLSGPQAAQVLGVSPATVKTHLGRCFEKLGVRSQVELARMLSALPPDRANFDGKT
jgi:DNA-binding CsgD family transcriptional regulator